MSDLIEFLRARLDEDAAEITRNTGNKGLSDDATYPDYLTYTDDATAAADDYLGRFKPPRMLREVEAKREIIDYCESVYDDGTSGADLAKFTLRTLVVIHSDHPDFRPEWRP